MVRVSKDSFIHFRNGPEVTIERQKHWVGRVRNPKGETVATCILVHPRVVITPYHAIEDCLERNTLAELIFDFDLFDSGPGATHTKITHAYPDPEDPLLSYSESSSYDRGLSSAVPKEDYLDYIAINLNSEFGTQTLEDGNSRGWLSLNESFTPFAGEEAKLLSYPTGQILATSNGRFEKSTVVDRINHTCSSSFGSSGGLLLCRTEDSKAVAMHIGSRRNDDGSIFNFGVPLGLIFDHIEIHGTNTIQHQSPTLKRLKIGCVSGRPDENRPAHKVIKTFFEDKQVQQAFANGGYLPQINDHEASQIVQNDIVDFHQYPLTIEILHRLAASDIAFVVVSKKDGNYPPTRDRLLAAYGYLSARLGPLRVHLVHHHEVELTRAYIGEIDAFIHTYSKSLMEIATRVPAIADATRNAKEDYVQGLFELGKIALPDFPDHAIFGEPDFGAEHSLHIFGFRFGRLKGQMQELIEAIRKKKSEVTIAFPGVEISNKNPYLLHALQAGGDETLEFLTYTRDLIASQNYPNAVLRRIRFIALDDIPTFILTAADLDHTEGRMLIAPAFPSGLNERKRGKPRWLVHNKLSNYGVYDAYRRVLSDFLENSNNRKDTWTLNQTEKFDKYIDKMSA